MPREDQVSSAQLSSISRDTMFREGHRNKVDTRSSTVHWGFAEPTGFFDASDMRYHHTTWYGTDLSGRDTATVIGHGCLDIVKTTLGEAGKGQSSNTTNVTYPIEKQIRSRYPCRISGSTADNATEVAVGSQQKTSTPSIRNIDSLREKIEKYEDGLLVLFTKADPTEKSLLQWAKNVFRAKSTIDDPIIDARILVSPHELRGGCTEKTMSERRSRLARCYNHYYAYKNSNEFPDFSVAEEVINNHPGCGTLKVWEGALREFQAFEKVSFDPSDVTLVKSVAPVLSSSEKDRLADPIDHSIDGQPTHIPHHDTRRTK